METALAILMVLGIFVGIPALIGFTIVGAYVLRDRRIQKTRHTKAMNEVEAINNEPTKEHVLVA